MDLLDFLNLIRRKWASVFIIVSAVILATGAIYFVQLPHAQTILLYSVGVSDKTDSEKSFDATKLADDFAHTIAGWMRSPTFSEKISDIAKIPTDVVGTSQAKQNFLVELFYDNPESADRITAATRQVITEEIKKYNSNSKFKFFTTLHGESHILKFPNLKFATAVALIGGLLLAAMWIALQSYFSGRVNSIGEAEKLLGTPAIATFRRPSKKEIQFLKALLKKLGNHTHIAGADINIKKLATKLEATHKIISLPKESLTLVKNEGRFILIVRLDYTRTSTLRQIRALIDNKIPFAVWG